MKKVIKRNKKGWYHFETEVEVKDVLLLLFCVIVVGVVLFKEMFLK